MEKNFQPMTYQNRAFYNSDMPTPSNVSGQNPTIRTPQYTGFNHAFKPLLPEPHLPFQGKQPKAMFDNHGFVNDNTLLQNNLYNELLTQEIKEFSVLIDSKDRNYQVYPNPFHYNVTFAPLPTSRTHGSEKSLVYEDPNPTISLGFENVRYIKLQEVILPIYNKTRRYSKKMPDLDSRGLPHFVTEEVIDTNHPLTENLYTVMVIEEYKDINTKSTNDVLSDSFATIYFDETINDSHFMGSTSNGLKVFPPDNLGKIDKLRIRFLDPYGNQLTCPHLDKNIKSGMICTCINDPIVDDDSTERYSDSTLEPEINTCFKHNLHHPLNPLFQNHIQLKVGVVEPYLNKKVFY